MQHDTEVFYLASGHKIEPGLVLILLIMLVKVVKEKVFQSSVI